MKKLLAAAAIVAMTVLPAQAKARTISHGSITFKAAPCGPTCAYWLDNANGAAPGVTFKACEAPFPPGSYADKVLRAPTGANFLLLQATPTIDWDLFICAKPKNGNNGALLAQGANSADSCQVSCPEKVAIPVRAGRSYVLRAYNWSDVADLLAIYWFKKL